MVEFTEDAFQVDYDAEADAAYIWVLPHSNCERIARTVCMDEYGICLDLDRNNAVLGIELLYPAAAYKARSLASEAGE